MIRTLVGIATFNRADLLPKAIASALDQRPTPSVAVIDDCSTDGTDRIASGFPEVAWTRRSINQGHMSARNEMMAIEGYDYFVSLDDDAWFLNGDEIAVAVSHLEATASVAAVAFDILSPDRPDHRPRGPAVPAAVFIGCGHVVRLSAVRRVGGYEPTPGLYGAEEKDLCLRLMDAGYEVALLPGVHVWHDKTPIARELPRQHRSGVCNDLVMTLRRTPLALLPMALPAKVLQHIAFSARHGLLVAGLEGLALFGRSIPAVWRTRKPVRIATLRAFMGLSRA